MRTFIRFMVAGALALTVTACGSKGEETARSNTRSLVDRFNAEGSAIEALGRPSASWSDEQLNSYETRLASIESLMRDLESANGDHGVTIDFKNSYMALQQKKSDLADARREKARSKIAMATPATLPATSPTTSDWQREFTVKNFKTANSELKALGYPSVYWSRAQLEQYIEKSYAADSAAGALASVPGVRTTPDGDEIRNYKLGNEAMRRLVHQFIALK